MKGRGPGPEDAARPLVWTEHGDARFVEVEARRLADGEGAPVGPDLLVTEAAVAVHAVARAR